MITGVVTMNREAMIILSVRAPNDTREPLEAVVDTGFNGFLTLPSAIVASLGLVQLGRQQVMFADGSVRVVRVYLGTVDWDGQEREVEVDVAEAAPLVGMALLDGYRLSMQVVVGGSLSIEALP